MSSNDPPPPDPQTTTELEIQRHDEMHPAEPNEIPKLTKVTPTPPKSPSEVGSFHSAEDEQAATEQTKEQKLNPDLNEANAVKELSETIKSVSLDNQSEIIDSTTNKIAQKVDEQTIEIPSSNAHDVPVQPFPANILNEHKEVSEQKNINGHDEFEDELEKTNPENLTTESTLTESELNQSRSAFVDEPILHEHAVEGANELEKEQEIIEVQSQKHLNEDVINDLDELESARKKPMEDTDDIKQESAEIEVVIEPENGENEEENEEKSDEPDEQKELDEDEIKESPAYIPKQGHFYMHDDARSVPPEHHNVFTSSSENEEYEEDDKERENNEKNEDKETSNDVSNRQNESAPKSRADRISHWKHDMFDERFQAPKNPRDLIRRYGRDIRRNDDEDEEENEEEEKNKRDLDKRRPPIQKQLRHGLSASRGSRMNYMNYSQTRGRSSAVQRSVITTNTGRGGRIVVNRSQNNNKSYDLPTKANTLRKPRQESEYNDSLRNDSGRRKDSFQEQQHQQQTRQEVSDTWDNDDGDSDGGWGKDDGQNWQQHENNYPPLPNRDTKQSLQPQLKNRSADRFDNQNPNRPQKRDHYPANQQQHRRGDANDRRTQTQGSNWQPQQKQTSHSRSDRGRASDYFDDDNKDIGTESGGFGRAHRTEAPASQREGRFAMGDSGRMETGQQNRGGARSGNRNAYHQQMPHVQREGRFADQHNNQEGGRGTGGDNGGRFGGGSQRGRGGGTASDHNRHGDNGYRSSGGGQGVHEQRRQAQQQYEDSYPHPRQPTEPVFFDTAEQQTRRGNQQPPPQRERRRLPIQSPH